MKYLGLCLCISFAVQSTVLIFVLFFFLYRSDINSQFLMIRVFMMLQVVFPTFDPPEIPASMSGVGHWVSIVLDLKNSRFQLLDSYYGPDDDCVVRLFRRMTDNIKRLWKDASNDRETPFSPISIENFPLDWIDVPQQQNKYEFDFFSLSHLFNCSCT